MSSRILVLKQMQAPVSGAEKVFFMKVLKGGGPSAVPTGSII